MFYETPEDWPARPPQARGAVRDVGARQDPDRGDAARAGRVVPLLGRFPHRHPLHGRAHRRQLQARGDAQPVPAPAAALGLDLHRLEHHLRQPRAALDLPRQARRPGEGRHPLRRVPAPPAPAPRRRDRRDPRRAALHRQGRGDLRLRRTSSPTPRARSARWSTRSTRPTRCSPTSPRRRCRSGSAAPRPTSTSSAPASTGRRSRCTTRGLPDRALGGLSRRARARRPTRSTPTTSSATASAR